MARDWLEGARRRTVASVTTPTEVKDERVGDSGLHGRVAWFDGTATQPLKRLQIHLYAINEDGTSKRMQFQARSDFEGNYKFSKIPAGIYKLTDDNVGTPKWRLKVQIREGEDAVLDLSPDNSLSRRDDFPKPS